MTSYCRNMEVQDHLVKQKRRWNVNYQYKKKTSQSLVCWNCWTVLLLYLHTCKGCTRPKVRSHKSVECCGALQSLGFCLHHHYWHAYSYFFYTWLKRSVTDPSDIWFENRDISCDLLRLSRQQFSLCMLSYSAWIEGYPAGLVIHTILCLCVLI